MNKNRKVSRPAPVRPELPKNIRVTTQRSRAMNRFVVWAALLTFSGSAAAALLAVSYLLRDDLPAVFAGTLLVLCSYAMARSLKAWDEIGAATERLADRNEALAEIRSRFH